MVLLVVFVSSSACFFTSLVTEPAVIASVDLTSVRRLSLLSSNFSMPLPGLLWLNWLIIKSWMPFAIVGWHCDCIAHVCLFGGSIC